MSFWIFFVISCGTITYIVYHGYVNRMKYNLPYKSIIYKNEKAKRIKYK